MGPKKLKAKAKHYTKLSPSYRLPRVTTSLWFRIYPPKLIPHIYRTRILPSILILTGAFPVIIITYVPILYSSFSFPKKKKTKKETNPSFALFRLLPRLPPISILPLSLPSRIPPSNPSIGFRFDQILFFCVDRSQFWVLSEYSRSVFSVPDLRGSLVLYRILVLVLVRFFVLFPVFWIILVVSVFFGGICLRTSLDGFLRLRDLISRGFFFGGNSLFFLVWGKGLIIYLFV